MGHIVKLNMQRRDRAGRHTLCRSGFHKWALETHRRFDVRQGRLITTERCLRCQAQRTRLS